MQGPWLQVSQKFNRINCIADNKSERFCRCRFERPIVMRDSLAFFPQPSETITHIFTPFISTWNNVAEDFVSFFLQRLFLSLTNIQDDVLSLWGSGCLQRLFNNVRWGCWGWTDEWVNGGVPELTLTLPAGLDFGPERGSVCPAAQQRCSPQTRYRWSCGSDGSPSGSLELGSTGLRLPESCGVTRRTPPLGQVRSHRSKTKQQKNNWNVFIWTKNISVSFPFLFFKF